MKPKRYEKVVPDSSVVIEGILSRKIRDKDISFNELVVHDALLKKLELFANDNKAKGLLGLEELDKLSELSKGKEPFAIRYSGEKIRQFELEKLTLNEIDSLVRDLAYEEDATLITTKKVIAKTAEAKNIKLLFIESTLSPKKLMIEGYFDAQTMSVHLRENTFPHAKKGTPGNWIFDAVENKTLTQECIKDISREIIEEASIRNEGFIEIERPGSTIVQLGTYRIVITKPPFSDGWEITAVKPVKKMCLSEYKISEKLMSRIIEQAEGILIAGAPGMGKTTFAAALAEYYAGKNKIVKTVEAPRDLVLPETITQYAISHGDAQEIHDILLLSRPDYTFFDEMRNTDDFKLFADLRLAGIGFIGVVHATKPIDAIQRFVGRIELGVIPQVIDTVIFIKNGEVSKVLGLKMVVKVPSGMTEADLARPIVVVTDFETKKLEYELYSYGEETVVVPVSAGEQQSSVRRLAAQQIQRAFRKYCDIVDVEIMGDNKAVVYVPEHAIAFIIGKQGKTISEIEKTLGISIDVQSLSSRLAPKENEKNKAVGTPVEYRVSIGKNNVIFEVDPKYIGHDVNIIVNGDFLLTAKVGKKSSVKVKKSNKIGMIIIDSVNTGEKVELVV